MGSTNTARIRRKARGAAVGASNVVSEDEETVGTGNKFRPHHFCRKSGITPRTLVRLDRQVVKRTDLLIIFADTRPVIQIIGRKALLPRRVDHDQIGDEEQ